MQYNLHVRRRKVARGGQALRSRRCRRDAGYCSHDLDSLRRWKNSDVINEGRHRARRTGAALDVRTIRKHKNGHKKQLFVALRYVLAFYRNYEPPALRRPPEQIKH
ncbi:unnamed protein product, partial [Brenthis ino]